MVVCVHRKSPGMCRDCERGRSKVAEFMGRHMPSLSVTKKLLLAREQFGIDAVKSWRAERLKRAIV